MEGRGPTSKARERGAESCFLALRGMNARDNMLSRIFVTERNDADEEDNLSRSSSRSSLVEASTLSTLDADIQGESGVDREHPSARAVDSSSSELAMELTFHDQEQGRQNGDHIVERYEIQLACLNSAGGSVSEWLACWTQA